MTEPREIRARATTARYVRDPVRSKKCSVWANHEGTNTTHCTRKIRKAPHAKIGKLPHLRPPELPASATRTPIRIAVPVAKTETEVFTALTGGPPPGYSHQVA